VYIHLSNEKKYKMMSSTDKGKLLHRWAYQTSSTCLFSSQISHICTWSILYLCITTEHQAVHRNKQNNSN